MSNCYNPVDISGTNQFIPHSISPTAGRNNNNLTAIQRQLLSIQQVISNNEEINPDYSGNGTMIVKHDADSQETINLLKIENSALREEAKEGRKRIKDLEFENNLLRMKT